MNTDPPGYKRNDPDETLGRLLYRQIADAQARRDMVKPRKVKFK